MKKLVETTTAQQIFKSMIDLNLDKDEVIYFEEFVNLLYEAGLLNPDFQDHQEFITNNRNYFIELKRIRTEGNKTFVIRNYLNDMFAELRRLNKDLGYTYKEKVEELIKEFESFSETAKPLGNDKSLVYLVMLGTQSKGKSHKKIVSVFIRDDKNKEMFNKSINLKVILAEKIIFIEEINTFRRPKAYLNVLDKAFTIFSEY
ncbi:TPA: hypothetical protein RFW42_005475 [Klebsiella pneumoniae subsp. pneumoniae]|nr:hypothetical protein [Klebsiella pneumoniae subsp. pneumoniae]HDU3724756.1 hypothetical protein [Klebsiella pneumoniae subsp. pneumoniae]HDU3740707.1 hypothetical protein [Klebsiella pneumoniae subsp. pneumoniae]HDU5905066.1 hypothetical protein [Klebsiella pneumoniae subsp. pneumoniae]